DKAEGVETAAPTTWPQKPDFREPPLRLHDDADFWDFRQDDADYFDQPGRYSAACAVRRWRKQGAESFGRLPLRGTRLPQRYSAARAHPRFVGPRVELDLSGYRRSIACASPCNT